MAAVPVRRGRLPGPQGVSTPPVSTGVVGQCHRCGQPVERGGALHIPVDHGTSASPDVLWHRDPAACGPVSYVRRSP